MDRDRFAELVKDFVDFYCSDYFDHTTTQIDYDAHGEGIHRAHVTITTIMRKERVVILCPSADDPDDVCIEAAEDSYLEADTGGLFCVLWNQAELEAILLREGKK